MPTEPTERRIELPGLPCGKPHNSKHWDEGIEWNVAGERAVRMEREDQLRESIVEIQALRESNDRLEKGWRADSDATVEQNLKMQDYIQSLLRRAESAESELKAIRERLEKPLPPRTSAKSWAWLGSEKVIRASEIDSWIAAVKG